MRIGISALIFNLEEALSICKKNKKINHIEIGIDNLYECEKILKYKDKIEILNLSVGIHLPMELNTCENIEYIRNSWIKFIEEINTKLISLHIKYFNLHLGYVMSNRLKKNRKKYLDISIDFFRKLNIECNLSIENVYTKYGDFSNIGNRSYDFEYIFNNSKNTNLCFCYDTGHNLINRDEYIQNLKQKIKIVHLSDNDGIDDIHIGVGRGILTINEVKEIINLKPEYLILEINHNHIEESINKIYF
ncbi:MAG: TIM barrel protein [Romboutsia sp.]